MAPHLTSLGSRFLAPRQKLQLARAALMKRIGGLRFDPSDFEIVHISLTVPGLHNIFTGLRIVRAASTFSSLRCKTEMSPLATWKRRLKNPGAGTS